MLEWLKVILGEAYTEEVDKKVSDEIGKGFVARTDFNTANADLKASKAAVLERDGQLEALKKSTGDVATLQQTITDLQAANADKDKTHAAELRQFRMDAAVDAVLAGAKAKNATATKALLAEFLAKAELGEDGAVKGLADEVKKLTEAEGTAFLFEPGEKTPGFKGFKPGEGGDKTTPAAGKKTEEMTYEELCAHLEAHPDAKLE